MADYTFRCPHCQSPTPVGLESLGRPVVCTSCARPFLAELPAGGLMVDGGDAGLTPMTTGRGDQPEKPVMTVNPVAFRERPVQNAGLVVLLLAGLIGLIMFAGEASQGIGQAALTALCVVTTLGSAGLLAARFALTRFESLTITTQRTVWARGVINRRSSEVQHDDIRNIQVQQDLVQRLVGAGTIAISSAGQDDMEITAHGIANPHRVIETIRTHQRRLVKGD